MTQRAAFDSHADDYEAQLINGLKVSGEPKEFFARDGSTSFAAGGINRPSSRSVSSTTGPM